MGPAFVAILACFLGFLLGVHVGYKDGFHDGDKARGRGK